MGKKRVVLTEEEKRKRFLEQQEEAARANAARFEAEQQQQQAEKKEAKKLNLSKQEARDAGLSAEDAGKKANAVRKIANNEISKIVAELKGLADGDNLANEIVNFLQNEGLFLGDVANKNKEEAIDLNSQLKGLLGSEDLMDELTPRAEARIASSRLDAEQKKLTDKAAGHTEAEEKAKNDPKFLEFVEGVLNIALDQVDFTVTQLLQEHLGVKLKNVQYQDLKPYAFVDVNGATIPGAEHNNVLCISQLFEILGFAKEQAEDVAES